MIVIERHGPGEVEITAPYNHEFITCLKDELDSPTRRWWPEKKVWIVKTAVFSVVHELIEEFYPDEELKVGEEAEEMIHREYESALPPRPKQPSNSWGPFRELYLTDDAPMCVIHAVYKALARAHHPDLGGDTKKMSRINQAYEDLQQMGRC